jgi:hypothetical protein
MADDDDRIVAVKIMPHPEERSAPRPPQDEAVALIKMNDAIQ